LDPTSLAIIFVTILAVCFVLSLSLSRAHVAELGMILGDVIKDVTEVEAEVTVPPRMLTEEEEEEEEIEAEIGNGDHHHRIGSEVR
jgi:hypothetical protein